MKEINWGIIGCGNVTEVKSGPAFNKINGSRLVAVMRRDGSKAADYARRHKIPLWYTNAEELINNPEVNAVYIATPPSTHAEYAIRVLQAGKPVYVEKPMASSYAECLSMKDAAMTSGIPLYVAYYRRYLPYFNKVKEILSGDHLGDLLYCNIDFHIAPRPEDFNSGSLPWRVIPEVAGAGYFYDLACHQFDLLEWFFGNPVSAEGVTYNRRRLYNAEDLVLGYIEYETGVPVSAHWCFTAGNKEHKDSITIYGSKGSLEFSTFDFTPIRLMNETRREEFRPENPENIQYWFIKNMVSELQASSAVIDNSESAARTNWLMDKILGKI